MCVHTNIVPLHHYVSSGGFASVRAFHVNELASSSSTDVKHAVVQCISTKHVTYQLRIVLFYNYLRTRLVCLICINQTVTDAVLYLSSTILGVE